ncbi:acyl-CoA dehydrogenase family protein [Dactylosporangium sp. NPDC051485]|uniref:acyl-CoA dehydrogenase family protein n=1 Tax=Dactylosporangium sp. NPDC051485 TaxID=3154846 RepID=UPI003421CBB3
MFEILDFDLSDDDRGVRDLAREIVRDRIAPHARELDETETFPADAIAALAKAGLTGILVPEDCGGAGGTMLQYCLVLSEIASACGATSTTYMALAHAMLPLLATGNDEQKARWLPAAARGELVAGMAITEPDAGSDLASLATRATRVAGGYRVSGSKIFVTNGTEAELLTVFVRTGDAGAGGISALLVETSSAGISRGRPLQKMGMRGSDTAEVFFQDVFVPEENLLGPEGSGFRIAMGVLGDARISTAAQAAGLARGAWVRAYDYAQQRRQFGRPIYEFQAVQLRLMTLYAKLCSAELMVSRLARMIDARTRHEYSVEAAMAKSYCADVAVEVTTGAVDVLGGYGYLREYELERFMRDAKVTQIYDGTNDINRLVMARQLTRRRAAR